MHSDAIESYLAGAAEVRKAAAGMTPEQARARPVAGKWSTLEVVCHLADMEGVFAERMKRVIAEERPALAAADENRWAAALAYHDRELEEELLAIESTRRQMARILQALPEAAWSRVGMHSEAGEVSLPSLVAKANAHLGHHLRFIHDKRKALQTGLP